MYDFVKMTVGGMVPEDLFENNLLDFERVFSENTGEIKSSYKQAFYKGLTFRIYDSNRIVLSGSLHKYFNDNTGNYNDFDLEGISEVIEDLKSKFNIDPSKTKISQLEFGVNLEIESSASDLINKFYMYGLDFFKDKSVGINGQMRVVEKNEYRIKVYNKGRQYDLPKQIVRFEMHIKKMAYVKRYNSSIQSLSDLLNPTNCDDLGEILISLIDKITLKEISLSDIDDIKLRTALINYYDPGYWERLYAEQTSSNPNLTRRKLDKFKEILDKRGKKQIQHLKKTVEDKWYNLSRSWEWSYHD